MQFEWNPDKERSNVRKHGVDFAEASTVFREIGLARHSPYRRSTDDLALLLAAHPVAQPAQARQHDPILFPVGRFLGANDVRQGGDENAYPLRCLDPRCVPFQVGIAPCAAGAKREIEISGHGGQVQDRILGEAPEKCAGAVEGQSCRSVRGTNAGARGREALPPTVPGSPPRAPGPRPDPASPRRRRAESPPCRRSARSGPPPRAMPRASGPGRTHPRPLPPRARARRPWITNRAARVASASRSAGVRRKVRSNSASVAGSGSPSATRTSKPAARTRRSARSVEGTRVPASARPTVDAATPARRASSARVSPARSAGFANEMRDGHCALIAIRQSTRQVLVTGVGGRWLALRHGQLRHGPGPG